MAKFSLFLIALLSSFWAFSQDQFQGQWKGEVIGLDMYINISEELLLTIPAQGVLNKEATNFEISGNRLDFYYQAYAASFIGELANDTITGEWKQSGQTFDVQLIKTDEVFEIKRSQEPLAEINYLSEDCLLYTSPSPRDLSTSRMPSSA